MQNINIYIKNDYDSLDSSYSQYILNYLSNVYPATTNYVKQIHDLSYIIYNYSNPLNVLSDTDIFIDSRSTTKRG